MRLSQFILQNLEPILQQWESFARSLKSGASMNIEALRDDAEQMLRFVAADIESDQTYGEEVHKATGHGPVLPIGESSAAHGHGIGRAVDRFSLVELVSEYRALRASVTRMWIEAVPLPDDAVAQIVRFNEALDQIAAEGVATFSERIDHDTDLFSASVGHDLANPLDVVTTSAHYLARSDNLSAREREAVQRIARAASRLSSMLADLRDFAHARLGGLVRIDRATCDIGGLVHKIVDDLATIHPRRHVVAVCSGDLRAHVDARRISQMVANLAAKALQHGTERTRVTVSVDGDADTLTIGVHNSGPAIEPERLGKLFDPLSRRPAPDDGARLGLGLYISQQIALAHDGMIDATSTDDAGTRSRYGCHGARQRPHEARPTLACAALRLRHWPAAGSARRHVTRHTALPRIDTFAVLEPCQRARDDLAGGREVRKPPAHAGQRQAGLLGDLEVQALTVFFQAIQDFQPMVLAKGG